MDGILLKILKRDNFVKKKCQKTTVFNSKNNEKVLLLSKKRPAFSLLRRAEKKRVSQRDEYDDVLICASCSKLTRELAATRTWTSLYMDGTAKFIEEF